MALPGIENNDNSEPPVTENNLSENKLNLKEKYHISYAYQYHHYHYHHHHRPLIASIVIIIIIAIILTIAPLNLYIRARLRRVARLGRPRSVYKSDVECRFVSQNGQMALKVKVSASHFQYQLQEFQRAYLVQLWWF